MKKLIRWFKAADKQILMDKDEYEAYQMLPNTVDIYRGIASKSNLNGISWTTNFETAKWFANRWNKNGYVVKAKIFKNNVSLIPIPPGSGSISTATAITA